MALDVAGLTTALQALLTSGSTDALGAASDWGDAIAVFAATGQANGIPAVVPPSATSALQAALGTQFSIVPGTAASAALGISLAIDAFWVLTTFVGMIAPPVPGGGALLTAALTVIFSNLVGTAASKASDIATAIGAHANSVIVTYPPANPFPVI